MQRATQELVNFCRHVAHITYHTVTKRIADEQDQLCSPGRTPCSPLVIPSLRVMQALEQMAYFVALHKRKVVIAATTHTYRIASSCSWITVRSSTTCLIHPFAPRLRREGLYQMDPSCALPFQAAAHDSLRHGLASLKEDALQKHPVQVIQENTTMPGVSSSNPQVLRDLYGLAFPAKLDIERQILSKFGRLPGLPSSKLGLESYTGELDQFGFESYLGLPEHAVDQPVELHSQMEQKLGMAGTKPVTRPMF